MHAHNNPTSQQKSSVHTFGRRGLLAGLVAGAALSIVPTTEADVGTRDELDWLIDHANDLANQIDVASEILLEISDRPDRPIHGVTMSELSEGMYASAAHADTRIYDDYSLIKAFAPFFTSDLTLHVTHLKNRQIAREIMAYRLALRKAWDVESGHDAADQVLEDLFVKLYQLEDQIYNFPCRDFSAVARKIAFLDRTLGDHTVLRAEIAMSVIWSLGGMPAKSYSWAV